MMRAMKRTMMLVTGLAMTVLGLTAQTYTIDWSTLDGGGGRSAGGGYVLEGTIGQPDAGPALRGGTYELQGGFWPGLIVASVGFAPTLFIQVSGDELIVSWTPETAGFVLETTDDLSSGWEPALDGNPIVIPAEGSMRFYRLRRD
jgi:hypothetical protein